MKIDSLLRSWNSHWFWVKFIFQNIKNYYQHLLCKNAKFRADVTQNCLTNDCERTIFFKSIWINRSADHIFFQLEIIHLNTWAISNRDWGFCESKFFMCPDTDVLFPLTEKILILKESSNFLIKFYFSNNIIESTVTLFTYAKKEN